MSSIPETGFREVPGTFRWTTRYETATKVCFGGSVPDRNHVKLLTSGNLHETLTGSNIFRVETPRLDTPSRVHYIGDLTYLGSSNWDTLFVNTTE